MNYVTPIPGRWYKLCNNPKGDKHLRDNWIILYDGDFYKCPYILNNKFQGIGNFCGNYLFTETLPEEVNPYVPEEYKIKLTYEIY